MVLSAVPYTCADLQCGSVHVCACDLYSASPACGRILLSLSLESLNLYSLFFSQVHLAMESSQVLDSGETAARSLPYRS
jgi:hypothetical protein